MGDQAGELTMIMGWDELTTIMGWEIKQVS